MRKMKRLASQKDDDDFQPVFEDCVMGRPNLEKNLSSGDTEQIFDALKFGGHSTKSILTVMKEQGKACSRSALVALLRSHGLSPSHASKVSLSAADAPDAAQVKKFVVELGKLLDSPLPEGKTQRVLLNADETQLCWAMTNQKQWVHSTLNVTPSIFDERHKQWNMTMLPIVCSHPAVAQFLPQAFLFKFEGNKKSIPNDVPNFAPPEFGDEYYRPIWMFNDSGIMTQDTFNQWVREWAPFLTKKFPHIQFLLLMDNHGSHYDYKGNEQLYELGIDHLTLPPRGTCKIQVCDTILNGPMKKLAKAECRRLWGKNDKAGYSTTRLTYPSLVFESFVKAAAPITMAKEFKKLGLFPFNPDVICLQFGLDWSKLRDTDYNARDFEHCYIGSTAPAPLQDNLEGVDWKAVATRFAELKDRSVEDGFTWEEFMGQDARLRRQSGSVLQAFVRHNWLFLNNFMFDFLEHVAVNQESINHEVNKEVTLGVAPPELVTTFRYRFQRGWKEFARRKDKHSFESPVGNKVCVLTSNEWLEKVRQHDEGSNI